MFRATRPGLLPMVGGYWRASGRLKVLRDPRTAVLALKCTGEGRTIEIAVVRPNGDVLLDTLVQPEGVPIDSQASTECGITDDMLAGVEVPVFADICDRLVDLLADSRVITWHSSAQLRDRLSAEANLLGLPDVFGTVRG